MDALETTPRRGRPGHRGREIREAMLKFHAEGLTIEDVARQLNTTPNNIKNYACRMRLTFKTDAQRNRHERHAIVRAGYADGLSQGDIARMLGVSIDSVQTLASRMGVTRTQAENNARNAAIRRGFEVPDHLLPDYRILRKKAGYSAREAGLALGLLKEDASA